MGSIEARFWANVVVTLDGCWLWLGKPNGNGYGRLVVNGRDELAHRFAYRVLRGPIPDGFTVDHVCHNESSCEGGATCPHRRCVNPFHLELVPLVVNVLRGKGITARNAVKTHCLHGHALIGSNLYERPMKNGKIGRGCKACRLRTNREWYSRRAA